MTHPLAASPLPGQTWRSTTNLEALVQPDGRWRVTTPGPQEGTVLDPRELGDAGGLSDWRVVRGPMPSTFHIDVRSRGQRPGQARIEHRTYTSVVNRNLDMAPGDWRHVLQHSVPFGSYMNVTFDSFTPVDVHEQTGHALFREVMRASDRRLRRIEDSSLFTRQADRGGTA